MSEKLSKVVSYITAFMLGEKNSHLAQYIGYTDDLSLFFKYKLVIYPSSFFRKENFGTKNSLPISPLQEFNNTPILFGKAETGTIGKTVVLYADFIASAFFLLSRYEEIVKRNDRDEHGRFIGKESVLFKCGLLSRPIVDEYGKILRQYLRELDFIVEEPKQEISKIYLTHDVDQLAHYRTFRGFAGAVSRFYKSPPQTYKAIKSFFLGVKYDPWFTFPWFSEWAENLKERRPAVDCRKILFIKTGGGEMQEDKPIHNIYNKDFDYLFKISKKRGVDFGLHPSYQAGINTDLIQEEKIILDKKLNQNTIYTRNHYLANREPEDMQKLIDSGLTDDFTMSFADVAGFRLGTSKPVKWINPVTLQVTNLTLHPLTLMDSTLSEKHYMGLDIDEAFTYCKKIINQVKFHNGELVLLWHNTMVEKGNKKYHRDLYRWIINYLVKTV